MSYKSLHKSPCNKVKGLLSSEALAVWTPSLDSTLRAISELSVEETHWGWSWYTGDRKLKCAINASYHNLVSSEIMAQSIGDYPSYLPSKLLQEVLIFLIVERWLRVPPLWGGGGV